MIDILGIILITRTAQSVVTIQIEYFETQIVRCLPSRVASYKDWSITSSPVLFMSGHLSIPYDAKSVFKA